MSRTQNRPALSIDSVPLATPSLEDLAAILEIGLGKNYQSVAVEVVRCPDLRLLGCAAAGLGGKPSLLEVGGEPYVHNSQYRDTHFDMAEMAAACGLSQGYILGAAIAHRGVINGHCGDLIPCVQIGGEQKTKVARVGKQGQAILENYASNLHGGLANLFLSEGQTSPVIRVAVKERTGKQGSFIQAIRHSLIDQLGQEQYLALGGVFELKAGKVRSHIMPDFECIAHKYYDERKDEVIADFLQFYETMGPDLLCFTVLWNGDPTGGQLHLRDTGEHTHFYHRGAKQEGGHYHYDITPAEVEYVGYFNLAERLYRINDIYAEIAKHKNTQS